MDIPLRHNFTLNGAWKILFPNPPPTGEGGIRRELGVEVGLGLGCEGGAANVNVQADKPEDVDGLIDSDSDDTSSMSDVAKHPHPSSIREGSFRQGLAVGASIKLGVENDGAAKAEAGGPEEVDGLIQSDSDDTSSMSDVTESHGYSQVLRINPFLAEHRGPEILLDFAKDHMAHTEQLLQTILIQNTDADRKEVWIELRGSVAVSVIDTVERARKAMAEFEESTDSWEVKDERLRRALGFQIDTSQERQEESQGIIIQDVEFATKEEVVEEGQVELYDGQDTMRNVFRSQDAFLRTVREKNIEIVEAGGSIEAKSAELHEIDLEFGGQESVILQEPFVVPHGNSSIEGESTTFEGMSIQTQDREPGVNTGARLLKGERSQIEAEDPQEQIYELDARELSGEADNDEESLNGLPKPLAELSGQGRAAAKAKAPVCVLQEWGSSKQQQCDRLDAMWRASSAYVEPIAGIPTNPHVETLDANFSRHELQGDILDLDDAAPGHQGPRPGTAVQETISTQATVTQVVMEDFTNLDTGTDSCPHPSDSSAGKFSPEAVTEVATAALLEQLGTEQDEQEGSNVGARDDIAKFDRGMSGFTLRTHILFSIVYAIWIVVLYRFIAIAVC